MHHQRDYKIHIIVIDFDNESQNLDPGLANIFDAFLVQILDRNCNGICGATVEVWYAAGREGKVNNHKHLNNYILFAS